MKTLQEIITDGNLAFLKIANVGLFKTKEHYRVLIESLEKELSDSRTRVSEVYIWECEDIPPDCAAIVIMRPEDAAPIKDTHEKLKRLREFAKPKLPQRKA